MQPKAPLGMPSDDQIAWAHVGRGSGRGRTDAFVIISSTKPSDSEPRVTVTLSERAMQRMGWQGGDAVQTGNACDGVWLVIKRDRHGCTLSAANGSAGIGQTVRTTLAVAC